MNRSTLIHVRVFSCVTFERCSIKIPTRIFCDTLQSNQAAHLRNTMSNKEEERKTSACRQIFTFLHDARARRRLNEVMKLAVRHSTTVSISSRHCTVFVLSSNDGRQGIHFLDASCCLRKTTLLKGSSECHVLFWTAILLTAYSLLVNMSVACLASCRCQDKRDQYCRGNSRCWSVHSTRLVREVRERGVN